MYRALDIKALIPQINAKERVIVNLTKKCQSNFRKILKMPNQVKAKVIPQGLGQKTVNLSHYANEVESKGEEN
jgi:hypothetical protein